MLSRSEDTAGTRTAKLARGVPGSSPPTQPTPRAPSRHSSNPSSPQLTRRESETRSVGEGHLLGTIGVTELLQQDDRPTFVIDIGDVSNFSQSGLRLLFANDALRSRAALIGHIQGVSSDPTSTLGLSSNFADFKRWALGLVQGDDLSGTVMLSCEFAGLLWTFSVIRKRLKVFNGQQVPVHLTESEKRQRPGLKLHGELTSSAPKPQLLDDSHAYFGPRASSNGGHIPGTLEALVHDDIDGNSDIASGGEDELSTSPLTNDDNRTGANGENTLLLTNEQRKIVARNPPEGFKRAKLGHYLDTGFFDWTRLPFSSSLPSHVRFARSVDWASTSIGPIEEWSPDLRAMCNLIMASPHPAAMYWGHDHVAIYNEAYILLAGKKHPYLMGSRYQDAWSEIWEAIEEVFANAMTSAQATMKDDDCLYLSRNGYLEETYFSWSIIPLIGQNGSVVGLYNPVFENTRRKIAERRMLTLRNIGEKTAAARHVSQFWNLLLEGLAYNEYDAPLVIIYSMQDESTESEMTSGAGGDGVSQSSESTIWTKQCLLEGALGIAAGHPAAPHQIDLKMGTEGFAPVFRQAMSTKKPMVLREDDGTLDARLLDDIQWRGFGDRSRVLVISPIHPTTGESTLGFLIMGTNPRRPYDEDYDLFVQLLGRQLATSVASVVLFEEEIRKGQEAAKMAAQDRIELSNQLAARTQEAIESERKFTRMAELAPVGMFMANSKGQITYTNDTWYDISSFPRDQEVSSNWINYIHKDDQERAQRSWDTVVHEVVPVSIQFRFKHPWSDKMGNRGETWVLASSYPEKNEQGQLKSIFGSVTDISAQKFAEGLQKRRMEEAVELKRQQENFVDITSHEMRNPLSAILQCSDEISSMLLELKSAGALSTSQVENIDSNIDAAQTITLCAQHQKRIVDDVLTLSKLDSHLLLVTPVDVQPVTVVQRALKMFEGELQTADISLELRVLEAFHFLKVEWVRLDPSRLLQVLINLITNAIKFTTTQEKRTIFVHVSASKERPSHENEYKVKYVPIRNKQAQDTTASPDWGEGEVVYIHFIVQDTGRGLTASEMKMLFQRFSQASPRTHITYGGSGLGLFISRELVELQGGQIGVASESGNGSTFAFYIKTRRSSAPPQDAAADQIEFLQTRKSSVKNLRPSQTMPKIAAPANPSTAIPTSPRTTDPSSSSDVASLNVLVVEDNLVNQKVLAKQLRRAGCTVYLANHGSEALEQIQRSRYWHANASRPDAIDISVVLLDLEMPVMDGQTCARRLREMQKEGLLLRHVPVIAVTANAREEQIRNTLEAGIDDVVSKPFRILDLLPKMRAVIEKCDGLQTQE